MVKWESQKVLEHQGIKESVISRILAPQRGPYPNPHGLNTLPHMIKET